MPVLRGLVERVLDSNKKVCGSPHEKAEASRPYLQCQGGDGVPDRWNSSRISGSTHRFVLVASVGYCAHRDIERARRGRIQRMKRQSKNGDSYHT